MADVRNALLLDLGITDYGKTYELQQQLVERRRSGILGSDLFLVTEHPSTFTLGRRGGREHLMVSEAFLAEKNIPLIHIERGGDITYHGPGQLVVYPIFSLRTASVSVGGYVALLEEVMLRLAARFEVKALRDPRNNGVWAGGRKLGSVGIAIRHGVSFHGLALNVDVDLEPFSWVNPCGLTGVSMTSLCRERGESITLAEVKASLPVVLAEVFDREIDRVSEVPERDPVQS